MVTFESPQFEDRQWVQPLLAAEGSLGCEYNFTNIYLWSRAYPQKIARLDGRLLVRIQGRLGLCYLYPAGEGPLSAAVDAMAADAASHSVPLTLVCVTQEQKAALEATCPGRFTFEEDRDGFDYLYDVNRLADLPGKKLHAKRNHIHRFDEQVPDWLLEPITPANVPECVELERQWAAIRQEEAGEDVEAISEETIAVIEALYHMEKLGLEGALIRADGSPVAFSLGGFITPECFDVNFEKSFGDIQGAYPVINRELARLIRARHPQVKWFNREDDMGLDGLRRAKLSYYPDILLTKYTAREVGA